MSPLRSHQAKLLDRAVFWLTLRGSPVGGPDATSENAWDER
jgi:hypothetical protein